MYLYVQYLIRLFNVYTQKFRVFLHYVYCVSRGVLPECVRTMYTKGVLMNLCTDMFAQTCTIYTHVSKPNLYYVPKCQNRAFLLRMPPVLVTHVCALL